MSYLTQSRLAADQILLQRVTACAVLEGVRDAPRWVQEKAWALSAQPGWVAAYASAAAARAAWTKEIGTPQPPQAGESESAVTDEMILTAVQALRPPPTTTDSLTSPAE